MSLKCYKVGGGWKGKSAGGCLNYPTWRFNPQLFVSVEKKRTVKISMTQEESANLYQIGFYVAISDGTGRRQLTLTKENLVEKVVFSDSLKVELEVTLSPSKTYVVIPCTVKPGQEGKFSFTFNCNGVLKITPLPPNREWKCVTGKGEWKGKTAGGCRNHPTCVNNPQFLIKARKATTAIILLSQLAVENFDAIGFYLVTTKSPKSKISKLRADAIVTKSDFGRGYEAYCNINLEAKKKYAIIPSTFNPGSESSFSITIFSEYDIRLKPLRDSKEVSIKSEWEKAEAGGSMKWPSWRDNPQFFLIMEKNATVTITLEQMGDIVPIGFYVIKGMGNRVVLYQNESILFTPTFDTQRSVNTQITLEKSEHPYVIIPCTLNPNIEKKFQLSVCIDAVLDPKVKSRARASKILQLVPSSNTWTTQNLKGSWLANFNGGSKQDNSNDWLKNPQFLLSAQGISKFSLLLTIPNELSSAIGFYVVKANSPSPPESLISSCESGDIVYSSPFIDGSLESSCELELPKGSYIIIPTTKSPNINGEFQLSVFVESEINENILNPIGNNPPFVKQIDSKLTNLGEAKWEDVSLGNVIGRGGFGVVYKGNWKNQTVAVKKLSCEEMDKNEYESFQMEMEIMSKLRHKNVLACLGASLNAKESFILTEYMSKGNMSDVLFQEPNLSWKIKIKMAIDAAEGMFYLHSLTPPVVHRDLKSLNLLVDENYTVKVADFGLSKLSTFKVNSKVGSLNWCAPEILLKKMAFTTKCDVYSFGMVLYELVTHHPPFKGLKPIQVIRSIDQGEVPKLPKDINEDLAQLIEDCWKTEPEDRPEFDEVLKRLRSLSEYYNSLED